MRELKAEKKAIYTELQSIRAHHPRHSSHLTEAARPTPDSTRNLVNPFMTIVNPQSRRQSQSPPQPAVQSTSEQLGYGHRQGRSPQVPPSAAPVNPVPNSVPNPLDPVERTDQRSTRLPTFQDFPPCETPEHRLNETLLQLEEQADYINQLAVAQETAILNLKAIAEQVEQGWKSVQRPRSPFDPPLRQAQPEVASVCEYLEATVPQVEKTEDGMLVLKTRAVDLYRAEREASLMAQSLRHRQPDDAVSAYKSTRSRRRKSFSWREVLTLLVGAVVLRLALNFVLAAFPGLWTPMVAMMVTPVAIAVFRTPLTTQSGFTWGARLLAVLVGLLVGGRL